MSLGARFHAKVKVLNRKIRQVLSFLLEKHKQIKLRFQMSRSGMRNRQSGLHQVHNILFSAGHINFYSNFSLKIHNFTSKIY